MAIKFGPPPELSTAEKAAWYWTSFLRVLVGVLCLLMIIAFGILMDSACNSGDLNFMGKIFAVVANMGYIFIAFLLFITQFEFEILQKHFSLLYYWPVRACVMIFMGVQTLNSREQLKIANLDSGFQTALANIAGYSLLAAGLWFYILSCFRLNKNDLSRFRTGIEDLMENDTAKEPKAQHLDKALLEDEPPKKSKGLFGGMFRRSKDTEQPSAAAPAINENDDMPHVIEDDDDVEAPKASYPFATHQPTPAGESADPFASPSEPSKPYSPPAPVIDDDIQKRRQAEDDELERMYANAASDDKAGQSRFAAAD
eukprot:TRINITY_DN7379_c1_g1_i1.p1 TRINITY_DN7379_c1_g1~~TRINITY_DN7379_c1_g1_i1.p1  ORF type:complete len:313 (+),score=83.74 TRINITY_DN7379_c1_g1_i1:55-993(+)